MRLFWSVVFAFFPFTSLRAQPITRCTLQFEVHQFIGPATLDLLKRAEARAEHDGCSSLMMLINTPGGALDTTREMVEHILNSPRPFLCLVAPSGGHAGSAGAILLQACHVNGALHGTNLGAATPVGLGGDLGPDLRQKILNDTTSWVLSLTHLRGRSDKFGQDIVTTAKAVTAEEALKLNAIDIVSADAAEFLKSAQGRPVKLTGQTEATVQVGPVHVMELDARYHVLAIMTDPELAYMTLVGSLTLLYFEVTHPGMVLPGLLGGLGLIVALIALGKLAVEWAGLILILLGMGLLIAELFLPTFVVVGVGGLGAVVLGSLFLFDPVKTGGYSLPLSLIVIVSATFAAIVGGLLVLVWRSRRRHKKVGFDELTGLHGRVVKLSEVENVSGMIEIRGETWQFVSRIPVQISDEVKVTGHHGLVLNVVPVKP